MKETDIFMHQSFILIVLDKKDPLVNCLVLNWSQNYTKSEEEYI